MNVKRLIVSITAIMFFSIPLSAIAKDVVVEGTFQGANCMFFSKHCPADMPSAHVALEPDFVLVTAAGESIYIPNLDKSIKVSYLHDSVRVKGTRSKDTVKADTLEVKKDGKYKQVWSLEEEKKERAMMERK